MGGGRQARKEVTMTTGGWYRYLPGTWLAGGELRGIPVFRRYRYSSALGIWP
jgi:hypothetical protein